MVEHQAGLRGPFFIWLLLYAGLIAHLSLFPWHFEMAASFGPVHWTGISIHTRGELMDSLANVVLYMPLGFIAYRCFGSLGAAIIACAALSGGIEWAQVYAPTRNSSLRDLLCNTAGTWAGASACRYLPTLPKPKNARWMLTPVSSLFLACWMLWMAFPFIPLLRTGAVSRIWQHIVHPDSTSLIEAGDMLFATLTLGCVMARGPWLLVSLAVLPLQGFFLNHTVSLARVLWGFLGSCAARFVPPPQYWLAGSVCLWLLVRELYPFHFQTTPGSFSWVPFESLFNNPRESYYQTIFGKLFLYLAAIWSVRTSGFSWLRAGLIPFAIAAAGEFLQQYLPGRTPEMTEPVLVAIAFILMRAAASVGP